MTEGTSTEQSALLTPEVACQDAVRLLVDELPLLPRATSYPLTSPSYCGSLELVATYDDEDGKEDEESLAEQQLHEPEPVLAEELRRSLVLIYPIMLTYILEFVPGLVVVMLVGHMDAPDTKRLVDAATLSTMFTNMSALSVGFGLMTALDTLCSQAHGANMQFKIGIYLQASVLVVGACLLPIFVANWYCGELLLLLGQDPEVARLAGEFSKITVFGVPFLFAYEMLRKLLQAQNIVKPLVAFAIVGNLINIIGGYALTYHTSLGFYGAALSRTLGYMALPLCLFIYFWWSRVYEAWWPGWQLRAAWQYAPLFLQLGVPGFLMMGLEWWAYETMAFMAGNLADGVLAVSAHSVLMNVASFSYTMFLGIAVSGNIRVGNCLGANLPKKAKLIARMTLMIVSSGSLIVAVLVYQLRFEIPKIIINDPAAIARAAQALKIMSGYVVIDATNCVVQGIYRGAGWQNLAAKTNILSYYAVGIPLGAVLAFGFGCGIEGLWIGFSAGMITTLSVCCTILYQSDWEQMAIEARARVAH